jgi:hypothetical protein
MPFQKYHAVLDWRAAKLRWVLGNILLAGFFWNTFFISELVDVDRITAIAAATCLTVDNNLWRKSHLRPSIVACNVDTVSDCRNWCLCPAGATVNGNMLIYIPREIVNSVNITPIPANRQSVEIEILVRLCTRYVADNLVF